MRALKFSGVGDSENNSTNQDKTISTTIKQESSRHTLPNINNNYAENRTKKIKYIEFIRIRNT